MNFFERLCFLGIEIEKERILIMSGKIKIGIFIILFTSVVVLAASMFIFPAEVKAEGEITFAMLP